MKEIFEVAKAVEDVRKYSPVTGSWTNFVTMNFVANAQLAVGGRAAMCTLPDETKPLALVSKAIYINVGTFQPVSVDALPEAAKAAAELDKPWVLDPVAAGLGDTRNTVINKLRQYRPDIIRGNASEIITLANFWELQNDRQGNAEGVDSSDSVQEALHPARTLAKYTGGTVAVSGEIDLIINESRVYSITGGSEMLKSITGAGCSLGGVMAVFAAVTDNLTAALASSLAYKWASQEAQKQQKGTASFQTAFLDNLSLLNAGIIEKYAEKNLSEVIF